MSLQRIEDPQECWEWTRACQRRGESVAVVPTMGALHEGHLSLVDVARQLADRVVTTIFVNPTQFGPSEDFSKYPRTLEADLEQLRSRQVDVVFVPEAQAMYPDGCETRVQPPGVATDLEGAFRPGHFEGVCTIVLKLLNIIPADWAVFGQKDYQQAAVIRQMVSDLNVGTRIHVAETIRESDGLAMSSRNRYLSPSQRERSLVIFRALSLAQELVAGGETEVGKIEEAMHELLGAAVDRIDYAVVRHAQTLQPVELGEGPAVGLIAVHVGGTRLIDNLPLRIV